MIENYKHIIDDVRKEINRKLTPEEIDDFYMTVYDGSLLCKYHLTLGRYIRNKYNLWSIPWTPEIIDGVDYSPFHPDQISNTIIEEVWKLGRL